MTIDEAIILCEGMAEVNQKVVDTHYISDDVSIDELLCDDTEIIEEKLAVYKKYANDYSQIAEWLKELKQLREQNKWIPVSERLPEHRQRVLITVERYNKSKVVRVAEFYDNWHGTIRKNIFNVLENSEEWKVGEEGLLAWMPLPEPYETEQEETE